MRSPMEAFPSSSLGLLADYFTPTTTATSIPWTRHEDKIFEHALAMLPDSSPNRWIDIADLVPGKSAADVKDHYDALVSDVVEIESGRVELPSYDDDSGLSSPEMESTCRLSEKAAERKKGKPWTKKEHQLFLLGLKKFGKGDWRSISRNVVITRTPTQVASHAQKYFLRQDSAAKHRKRSSIHDITTVEASLVTAATAVATATTQCQPGNFFSITQPPSPSPSPSFPLPQPHQFAPQSYFPNQRSLLDYY